MKIVFITDFAAIQQESKQSDVEEMLRKVILQILIYLNQSQSNTHPIHVGFKYCDTRACDSSPQYQIPRQIANSKRDFHEFSQNEDILTIFSAEQQKHENKNRNETKNMKTPISSSRSDSRSQLTTPTTTIAAQLTHKSGLSQIVVALLQCIKQYEWSDTLLTNDDHDTLEPQMIFILSSVPNANSIETIPQWTKYIKILSQKSIAVNFIHIPPSLSTWLIPFGRKDDAQEMKHIQRMDMCLRQLSQGSIGCIPLSLLWLAPIINLNHPFIQMFKHNGSLQLSQYDTLCQEVIRWNGNIVITSSLTIDCDLLSMEYNNNKWKKYKQILHINDVYRILQNDIECLHIDGMLTDDCLKKMDHIPYISLIIRPKKETQRFQQLFVSSARNKAHFVVRFNNKNMKGIMYSVIPSFVILRIYLGITWNTRSKLQQLTIHNDTMRSNTNQCIESMLNRDTFMTKIRNSKNISAKTATLNMKQKMKRGLKLLYTAQINKKKQLKEEEKEEDLSHLELSLTSSQNYNQLCTSFMNIYNMLLSKKSLKPQHAFGFIDITYKSFLSLCTALFGEKNGRGKVKLCLLRKLFIDPLQFTTIRGDLNLNQQLFDIKLQILLLLEFGFMHFKSQKRVDPMAKSKQFIAFLQKLEIKDTPQSFSEFRNHIVEGYGAKLPKTFTKYYQSNEEDIPMCITSYVVDADPIKPILNRKRKRKRRFTENIQPNPKRLKKTKTQRQSNVIITPMLAVKTNRNQKLMSSTSRRTITRSQRGGAIRSMKRPLRLVLGDTTNSNETPRRKKRKLHKKKKGASISKAATAVTNVFSSNQNRNPLTNSALKKRSSQWDDAQRVRKSRRSRRPRRKSMKATPPLKRCMTESNLMNPLFHSMPLDIEERGQSLPTQSNTTQSQTTTTTQSTSPLWPPPLSRTQSVNELSFNFNNDARNAVFDVFDKIDCAMEGQEWMRTENQLPPQHMVKEVYIHPFIAASNTNSIGPTTPLLRRTFNCASKRTSFIPETPDEHSVLTCDGNGASNIKSECKINIRREIADQGNNETQLIRKMTF